MTYEQTVDYLFQQLPMYQRLGKVAFKKDLSNTLALCKILEHPEKQFKSIHIAGTNGKGSTAHMLASIFQEAGYKTGLYTSPHLKDFRERVRINGEMISQQTVIDFVADFQDKFNTVRPSFFEWTVALAFHVFARERVDIAIIETGLGGRLDSTNVILPELSIITNIDYDHMEMLGDTLEKIAEEKAGIIKENVPVVIGEACGQEAVFWKIANDKLAPIYWAEEWQSNKGLSTDLLGKYQKKNIRTVFLGWWLLRKAGWQISFPQLQRGLERVVHNTNLRGRWEILQENPKVVAETAHNEAGLKMALEQVKDQKALKVHFVLGFVKDKQLDKVLSLFPKEATYYFCAAAIPRALPVNDLHNLAAKQQLKGESYPSVAAALEAAKQAATPEDLVFVGGSNFVVAEVV
jgi:dihydrofolate synthase/folylpolyglutamate synthase